MCITSSDDEMVFLKWGDFVKIKLHSNENLEWMKFFFLNELIS